jgi:hypothetical protein
LHATQRDKEEHVKARAKFIKNMPNLAVDKLVFVDETSVNLGMTRTYARAARGQRAEGDKPYHPDTMSLIGAMNVESVTAALLVDGPVDGATFNSMFELVYRKIINILFYNDSIPQRGRGPDSAQITPCHVFCRIP